MRVSIIFRTIIICCVLFQQGCAFLAKEKKFPLTAKADKDFAQSFVATHVTLEESGIVTGFSTVRAEKSPNLAGVYVYMLDENGQVLYSTEPHIYSLKSAQAGDRFQNTKRWQEAGIPSYVLKKVDSLQIIHFDTADTSLNSVIESIDQVRVAFQQNQFKSKKATPLPTAPDRNEFSWTLRHDQNIQNRTYAFKQLIKLGEREFPGVDLQNSNLNGCDLSQVNLSNAQLKDATLVGANLNSTVFKGSDVTNLDATNAIGISPEQIAQCRSIVGIKGLSTQFLTEVKNINPKLFSIEKLTPDFTKN